MERLSAISRPARLENIGELLTSVVDCANGFGFDADRMAEIEMALEEWLNNIISYAYPETEGDISIACYTEAHRRMMVEITDSGIPFNLLEHQPAELTDDLMDRQIGGVGIIMMKNFFDDIQYERRDDKNILRLFVNQDA